mmetsp:Transcript_66600/g.210872  ORF Transcript_66600/g.210872 Transcript_66600/m.210872 type:complete len:209 (+) Transcript_66600:1071-1697(+)
MSLRWLSTSSMLVVLTLSWRSRSLYLAQMLATMALGVSRSSATTLSRICSCLRMRASRTPLIVTLTLPRDMVTGTLASRNSRYFSCLSISPVRTARRVRSSLSLFGDTWASRSAMYAATSSATSSSNCLNCSRYASACPTAAAMATLRRSRRAHTAGSMVCTLFSMGLWLQKSDSMIMGSSVGMVCTAVILLSKMPTATGTNFSRGVE